MHWIIWNNTINEKEVSQFCGHLFLTFIKNDPVVLHRENIPEQDSTKINGVCCKPWWSML